MTSLNNIKPTAWSRKTSKRVWRGNGSGKWTYSTRWMNGQNCRSWGWVPDWFEWGQTPLFRRMPKLKGFSNAVFKKHYNVINLSDVNKLAESGVKEVNLKTLLENNVVRRKNLPVKLLWNWELKTWVKVVVNKASESAKQAVEKAWGELELV